MHTAELSAMLEADERGSSRYELHRSVVSTSVVAAVDTVTGDFAVASPDGTTPNVLPAHALRLKKKAGLEFEAFDLDAQWVKAICVRPGLGAWKLSAMDGSSGDDNPVAGTLQIDVAHLKPFGAEGSSPGHFRPRDVLVAIDPYTMTVIVKAVNE